MAFDIVGFGTDFLLQYGLIAIFILLVLDGALLLPVFPGEVVLVFAVGAYVTDVDSLIFIVLFTSAAGLVGSLLLYGITRGGGRKLVEKYPGFFMMPRKRRERLERVFAHPAGQSLVLFLRLIPLTRILVNIPAGLAKMPLVRFIVLSTIGLVAYHAAFLWFTWEAQRDGSAVAAQTDALKETYAAPVQDWVQANAILTGAAVLILGIFVSIRASRRMIKDPEESAGSLLGTLATATLFWGGIALAVMLYMEPETVLTLIAVGGLDMDAITAYLGYPAIPVLAVTAGVSIVFGLILGSVTRGAKRRRKEKLAQQRKMEARKRQAEIRAAVVPTRAEDVAMHGTRASGTPYTDPTPVRPRDHSIDNPAQDDPDLPPTTRDPKTRSSAPHRPVRFGERRGQE